MTINPIEIITSMGKYPAPFTHRVLIVCHEKNIPYTLTPINTYEKPTWFLDVAPLGQVPVMRVENTVISDSRAIWEYLDTTYLPHLLPQEPLECAKHRAWIGFADELAQEIAQFVKRGNLLARETSRLNTLFDILDSRLKGPYFFGNAFSMVDIILVSHILWLDALEQSVLPNLIISAYPKIFTWLNKVKQRASLKETMGENFTKYFIELLENHNLIA